MVLYLDDALEDGRVVLGVGVDQSLDIAVEILLEHFFLYIHDALEDKVDVGFCVLCAVQREVLLLESELGRRTGCWGRIGWGGPIGSRRRLLKRVVR
jgi:hypothetical protein